RAISAPWRRTARPWPISSPSSTRGGRTTHAPRPSSIPRAIPWSRAARNSRASSRVCRRRQKRTLADQGMLELGEMRLEYRMIGPRPDAAPTLVLLHEGLGCVAGWGNFARELAAATGAGVFVYSRAGYGRSSPGKLPRPVSFMHDEARDVLPRVLA